jgi:HPt (histidine-containing phosphotransfer) domain-containing protein
MTQNSLDVLPTLDHGMLLNLKQVMGEELHLMFIHHFIDGVPAQLEALKISIINQDILQIRQKSHRLKGESLQMGANQFAAICQLFENIRKEINADESQRYQYYLAQLELEFQKVKIALQRENGHEN